MRVPHLQSVAVLIVAVFTFSEAGLWNEAVQTTTACAQTTTACAQTTTEAEQASTEAAQASTEAVLTTTDAVQTTTESVQSTTDSGVVSTTVSPGTCGSCNDRSFFPGTFVNYEERTNSTTGEITPVNLYFKFNETGMLDPKFIVECIQSKRPFGKRNQECPVYGNYTGQGSLTDPTTGLTIRVELTITLDHEGIVSPQQKIRCIVGPYGCDKCNDGCPTSGDFTFDAVYIDPKVSNGKWLVSITYALTEGGISDFSQIPKICIKC